MLMRSGVGADGREAMTRISGLASLWTRLPVLAAIVVIATTCKDKACACYGKPADFKEASPVGQVGFYFLYFYFFHNVTF